SLKVSTAGRSRVIDITFESEDRLLAALAANTVAELYIVDELEARFEAIQGATTWLNNRVAQLRDQVAVSEREVEKWRSANGIVETTADGGGTVLRQQITTINGQLAIARSELADSQAKVSVIQRASNSPAGVSALPDIIASATVQQLNNQAADIRQRVALSSVEFGPRHPIMVALRAELDDVDRQMGAEINVILEGTRNQQRISSRRVDELTRTLETLDGQSAQQSEALVHLATLKSVSEADRLLLTTFIEKFNITVNADAGQSNARVISAAEVPNASSFPNRKLMAVVSLGFALAFSLALAFVLERLEGGFRSSEEIEKSLGVPGLGLIPEVRSVPGFKRVLEEVVLDNPLSHYAESLRRLYTTVLLQEGDPTKSSIVFTSAMPGEGKTTLVVALGRVVAAMGRRVVVIDCDFRRPRLHKALGATTNGRGLMQLLLDNDEISEVIEEDPRSGLHFIKAGTDFVRPMNLLESPRFREVLAELRDSYDIVLIDAPPILAVSDGLLLASRADQTVIVAKWHDTQREAIAATVKQVAEAGANIAGVVLNQVNVAKNSNYRYGDSMLYTKQFSKYYTQ
ncbi:MAG: GumC family protein, partial [Alphaproteobacteria bacterium]